MKAIENLEDVKLLVNTFYERIREHEDLGPIFNNRIGNMWDLHLDTLTRFWETLLLNNRTYYGAPFPKHIQLPIEPGNFDQWVALFTKTVDDLFEGDKANEAKLRATSIAQTFKHKHAAMHVKEAKK